MTTKRTIIRFKERPRLNVMELIGFCTGVAMLFAAAVLVLLALASCSIIDEDTSDCPPDSLKAPGRAIAFTVANGDSTARGTSTRTAQGTLTLDGTGGTESLREKGFGVFACHTGVHPYVSMSTTPDLMYNQRVAFDGLTSTWTYNPLVYWPNSDDGLDEYVTFFAYGPHSDEAPECIVDMSHPDELGDPWLTYQLGGSEDDWRTRQADLVYDFKKDQKRSYPVSTNIAFSFKHALACMGDQVTVICSSSLLNRMKGLYTDSPVVLTLKTLTLDYVLTRKGRLVLNSSDKPNWQAVESEDTKVHRTVSFSPDQEMARATSATACSSEEYVSPAGQGVFYIPLEVGSERQRIDMTATYALSTGLPQAVVEEGTVKGSYDLGFISEGSEGRNLLIRLDIPDPAYPGVELSAATVGMVICSHGKAHAATADALACGGEKVAVVAYVGGDAAEGSSYSHGLAIALKDATDAAWCSQTASFCLEDHTSSTSTVLTYMDGSASTSVLASSGSHTHVAATAARNYKYADAVAAGAHPAGASQWFLPSMGQWNLVVKAMTGRTEDLSNSANSSYTAGKLNTLITAAGGTGLQSGLYWSSTESSVKNAWYMGFDNGRTNSTDKTATCHVRPVMAF